MLIGVGLYAQLPLHNNDNNVNCSMAAKSIRWRSEEDEAMWGDCQARAIAPG